MGDMNNNGNDPDNLDLPKDLDNYEPFDDSNTIPLPSYNKKKNKNIMAIAIAAIVLIGATAGFIFRGYLVNQVMLLTKSPTEYYSYVEHKSIGSGIDMITKDHAATTDQYKEIIENGMGTNIIAELSISPEFAGLNGLSDIGNIKLDTNVFMKDLKQQSSTELFYKDQSLANLNALYNLEDASYYLQVPELSNAFLLFSMADIMAQNESNIDMGNTNSMVQLQKLIYGGAISSEKLNQLLAKYTNIAIDGLKNVEQNGDTELSISDASGKYTSLTVQITAEDLYEIGYNILDTAKTDNDLQGLVVDAGITTEEEYNASIVEALQSLESNKDSILGSTTAVNMTVYVDSFGTIIGREFTSSESSDIIGYYAIRKGTGFDFTAFIKEGDSSIASITGSATFAGKKLSGHAVITIDDATSPVVATLDFNDLEQVKNTQYYNGSMTLTSDNFNGISLGLDLNGSNDTQQMNFKMLYGNIEGATLNIASKEIPYKEISLPADSEEIYNATTDIYGYMGSMDLSSFIDHVYEVTGIDLSSIFYGMMGLGL
ncbi:MAG: hypothetical protein K0S61_3049 [Anaerocolumna sp.]|nr:hypothetical protein [Anaerocolumna sp.]